MLILSCFLLLCLLLVIGVSVPMAFGAVLMLIAAFGGHEVSGFLPTGHWKLNTVILLAIPLFILAGSIMERGKIAAPLIDLLQLLVGRVRGRPERGGRRRLRRVRVHFGERGGDADLHRLDHDAAPAAGELSRGHRVRPHRRRLPPRPSHSAERLPDPLRMGDPAVGPQVLSFHGGARPHPRGAAVHRELLPRTRGPGPQARRKAAALRTGARRPVVAGVPGAGHARLHPRRNLRRNHDPHRGGGGGRDLRDPDRVLRLQGTRPPELLAGDSRSVRHHRKS